MPPRRSTTSPTTRATPSRSVTSRVTARTDPPPPTRPWNSRAVSWAASPSTSASTTCALLHLYPRGFREEYGADRALLVAASLRDERAGSVVARTLVDLAITVPTRHLEAHVSRA